MGRQFAFHLADCAFSETFTTDLAMTIMTMMTFYEDLGD